MKKFERLKACRLCAVLTVLWIGVPQVVSQSSSGDWNHRFQEVLRVSGNLPVVKSESLLRSLLSDATTRDQEAAAALALARLLTNGAAERQREADAFFEQAVRAGSGQIGLDARNAWGVALLRQGRPGEAAEVFRALLTDVLPRLQGINASTRARYLYNYGVALEQEGQIEESLTIYEKALRRDPGLARASDALVQIFEQHSPGGKTIPASGSICIASLDALFGPLLDSGRTETAARYLAILWENRLIFGERDQVFPRWAYWLVRYLTIARVSLADFERNWLPRFQDASIEEAIRNSPWLGRVREAYLANLPVVLERLPAQDRTSPWSWQAENAKAFAELLQVVGEAYRAQGRSQAALARYALAWSSAGSWKAGVYLTDFLQQAPAELDPDTRIIASLAAASRETEFSPSDAAGWRDLSHFHVLLAQAQQENGSPLEALDSWKRAVEAHEAANKQAGRTELAPGLYAGLGNAYEHAGLLDNARSYLLTAGEQYRAIARPDLARAILPGIFEDREEIAAMEELHDPPSYAPSPSNDPRIAVGEGIVVTAITTMGDLGLFRLRAPDLPSEVNRSFLADKMVAVIVKIDRYGKGRVQAIVFPAGTPKPLVNVLTRELGMEVEKMTWSYPEHFLVRVEFIW